MVSPGRSSRGVFSGIKKGALPQRRICVPRQTQDCAHAPKSTLSTSTPQSNDPACGSKIFGGSVISLMVSISSITTPLRAGRPRACYKAARRPCRSCANAAESTAAASPPSRPTSDRYLGRCSSARDSTHASPIAPEPQKGSKTVSPRSEKSATSFKHKSSGFSLGCRPFLPRVPLQRQIP